MATITPLHPLFAARVGGLDLTQDLDDATFAVVRAALERYSVLVVPGQAITDAQQIRFSERFGPLEATRAGANGAGGKLIVLTNIAADGGIAAPTDAQVLSHRADQLWHTNSSFKPVPARASLLERPRDPVARWRHALRQHARRLRRALRCGQAAGGRLGRGA